jgi:hypothetical protein
MSALRLHRAQPIVMSRGHTPELHRHWLLPGMLLHGKTDGLLFPNTDTRAAQHVATLQLIPGRHGKDALPYPDGQTTFCAPHVLRVETHTPDEHLSHGRVDVTECPR